MSKSICSRKNCTDGCSLCDLKDRAAYFEEPDTRTWYEQDVQRFKNICIGVWEAEDLGLHQVDLLDDGCVYLVDPEKDALNYGIAHILKYLEYKGEIDLKELGRMVKSITGLTKSEVHSGGGVFKRHLEIALKEEANA